MGSALHTHLATVLPPLHVNVSCDSTEGEIAEWHIPGCFFGEPRIAAETFANKSDPDVPRGRFIAKRLLAAGSVVHRCYCIEVESGCFTNEDVLGKYTKQLPYEQVGRCVMPLGGWYLLLRQVNADNESWNLEAELIMEPAQLPLDASAVISLRKVAWLVLRASRIIHPDEELVLRSFDAMSNNTDALGTLSPMEQAVGCMDPRELVYKSSFAWWHKFADALGFSSSTQNPGGVSSLEIRDGGPKSLKFSSVPKIAIQASSRHGVGVFALRDLEEGEVAENCPVWPFQYGLADRLAEAISTAIARSFVEDEEDKQTSLKKDEGDHAPLKLQDYVFASTFRGDDLSLLLLGSGCVFNHGRSPNVRAVRYESTAYVWAWVTTKSVPRGTELLFDYGEFYWKKRGIDPL